MSGGSTQSGTDLGSVWRQPLYNDSSWTAGQGHLFVRPITPAAYPEATNTALLSTNGSGNSILTYYFRTHFNFPTNSKNVLMVFSNLLDDARCFI